MGDSDTEGSRGSHKILGIGYLQSNKYPIGIETPVSAVDI
jgi:hypothetical protein